MKLYRIKLKGMHGYVSNTIYGHPYVIANDPTEALRKVQDYLNERDLGFRDEREMVSIELLAETGDYPECHIQLFM